MEPTANVPDLQPPHSLALNNAYTWAQVAVRQADRLMNGASYWEAYALLLSLRQLVRAAEMAQGANMSRRAKQILNSAVARFKDTLPDLVDMRDIIDHFDQYSLGKGWLQDQDHEKDPTLTDAQLAANYKAYLDPEASYDQPVICVGKRRIVVAKVGDAVVRLFDGMGRATDAEREDNPPVAR